MFQNAALLTISYKLLIGNMAANAIYLNSLIIIFNCPLHTHNHVFNLKALNIKLIDKLVLYTILTSINKKYENRKYPWLHLVFTQYMFDILYLGSSYALKMAVIASRLPIPFL